MTPYRSAFDNFFLTLRISRVNYKASAQFTLAAVRAGGLPATFTPLAASLELHISSFDENLTERLDPTAATTEGFKVARKRWLRFVDDTMKDHVTPKLRTLPSYADFKKLTRGKLSVLEQSELIEQSKPLLALYVLHAAAMGAATLVTDSVAAFKELTDADATRTDDEVDRNTAGLALKGDRDDIATDLFNIKNQLHLRYPTDGDKVYSFFDFSKVFVTKPPKKVKKQAGGTPPTP